MRAVTVDWWGTLVVVPAGEWENVSKRIRLEGIQRILKAHGVECTYARLDIAYDLWTDHLRRAWRRNLDLSPNQQILDLLASAGYDGVANRRLIADLHEPIGAPLLVHPPNVQDGALETLQDLKAQGLKLAIISNTGRTWGRFLRQIQDRIGLADLFDHRTFSDEERVRKPAAAIFERTAAALKVRPEEVAHVGDDRDADVRGAHAAGVKAIWYDTGRSPVAPPEADGIIHAWRELPEALGRW